MGSSIFSWAIDFEDLCSTNDYALYFEHYVKQTNVCLTTFLIGIGIALAIAAIFYFGICNTSFTLSKRVNWVIALIITAAASFFASSSYLEGHDGGSGATSSGIYADSYNFQETLSEDLDDDNLATMNGDADNFRTDLNKGEFSIFTEIALLNMAYSVIFFLCLSFVFKRFTTHGKNIPV